MKRTISSVILGAWFLALSADAKPPPNFVVIFADDQGYGDVGCYGAEGFRTPHLDRMATEGTRFTDFYVAATVCTPSRAALLTGCYPKRVGLHEGVLFPYSETGLAPAEVTLAEVLKERGYATACIGKWHLGHHPEFMPNRQGFDYFFGVPYSNDMDAHRYRGRKFTSPPLPLYRNTELVESGPNQRYLTRRYAEEAAHFIREHKDGPFFLYVAHSMPHLPLHVSETFKGSSERGLYGDVIQELDWSVGQILAAVSDAGIDERTLVLYTSDNGPAPRRNAGSAGPLRGGKGTTWEGGQRVPALMRWPGTVPAGRACDALVTAMDILPTFAQLAAAELPGGRTLDGRNVTPVLLGEESAEMPNEAFYFYGRDGRLEAVRSGKWKLHTAKAKGRKAKKNGPFQPALYDLEKDNSEKYNLAGEQPDTVSRLEQMMNAFDARLTREARPVGRRQEREL